MLRTFSIFNKTNNKTSQILLPQLARKGVKGVATPRFVSIGTTVAHQLDSLTKIKSTTSSAIHSKDLWWWAAGSDIEWLSKFTQIFWLRNFWNDVVVWMAYGYPWLGIPIVSTKWKKKTCLTISIPVRLALSYNLSSVTFSLLHWVPSPSQKATPSWSRKSLSSSKT